jgi:hypothetical protein
LSVCAYQEFIEPPLSDTLLGKKQGELALIVLHNRETAALNPNAPVCSKCGSLVLLNSTCMKCDACGSSAGFGNL